MNADIVIAMIAFAGTALGTFGGIFAGSKLTAYRIEQLEKRVAEHNHFAQRIPIVEEKVKVLSHRVTDLEKQGGTVCRESF